MTNWGLILQVGTFLPKYMWFLMPEIGAVWLSRCLCGLELQHTVVKRGAYTEHGMYILGVKALVHGALVVDTRLVQQYQLLAVVQCHIEVVYYE